VRVDYQQLVKDVISRKRNESDDEHQLFFLQQLQGALLALLQSTRYRSVSLDELAQAMKVWMLEDLLSKESKKFYDHLLDWVMEHGYGKSEWKAVSEPAYVIRRLLHDAENHYRKRFPEMGLEQQDVDAIKSLIDGALQGILETLSALKQDMESGESSDLLKRYVLTEEQRLRQLKPILKVSVFRPSGSGEAPAARSAVQAKKSVRFHPDTLVRRKPPRPYTLEAERPNGDFSVSEVGLYYTTRILYKPNPGVQEMKCVEDGYEVRRWRERNPLVRLGTSS